VARASVIALFAKQAAFLRTPKTSERTSWWHALRANWAETVLALCGVAGMAGGLTKWSTLGGPLLAGLLFVPTLGMAAAPFNSWAARRAALPAYLRQRRETEYRRDRRSFAAGVSTGGAIVVGLIAAAAIALMLTGRLIHAPSLVQPVQAPAATATAPAPTPTATPSSTPTATPSSTPTPTATPTSTPTPTPSSTPTATPTTATPTATSPATPPASSAPATSAPATP
jgi:hypothetical protein